MVPEGAAPCAMLLPAACTPLVCWKGAAFPADDASVWKVKDVCVAGAAAVPAPNTKSSGEAGGCMGPAAGGDVVVLTAVVAAAAAAAAGWLLAFMPSREYTAAVVGPITGAAGCPAACPAEMLPAADADTQLGIPVPAQPRPAATPKAGVALGPESFVGTMSAGKLVATACAKAFLTA